MIDPQALTLHFGDIDIYVFDQILKGRLQAPMRILDAGCGNGRNVRYLIQQEGIEVHGVDQSPSAIAACRRMAEEVGAANSAHFAVGDLHALDHPDGTFDAVIAVATLHFAENRADFDQLLAELWRVLRPGGLCICRLATTITIADQVVPLATPGRYRLPDGSDRFLVDESTLLELTRVLGADLLEPLKTTNVQGQRAMTTWVLRKQGRDRPYVA